MTEAYFDAPEISDEDLDNELTTKDKLPFEPSGHNESEWNLYHMPSNDTEIEMALERIACLRGEIAKINEHADEFAQKKKDEYEEFLSKVELYRESASRQARKRLHWLMSSLEIVIRQQPDDVKSMKFINGVLKRRKMNMSGKVIDKNAAMAWIKEHKMEHLLNVKQVENVSLSALKEAIKQGGLDKDEIRSWFDITEAYDKVSIVTSQIRKHGDS